MSTTRNIDFLSQKSSSSKRRKTSTKDKGFNVVTKVDSPSINRSAFGSKGFSFGTGKESKTLPAWATPTHAPPRNPFNASQASTSSYITTPGASPRSPSPSAYRTKPRASLVKPSDSLSTSFSAASLSLRNLGLSFRKRTVPSVVVPQVNRSLGTPKSTYLPRPSVNSASKTSNLADKIRSSSLANAAVSRPGSITSISSTRDDIFPKSMTKPGRKPTMPQSTIPKEKPKTPLVIEVIPTSDDEEMELDHDSVIVLGDLEAAASRKCSRSGCRAMLLHDHKYRSCDLCREKSRANSRKKRDLQKQTVLAPNDLPPNTLEIASNNLGQSVTLTANTTDGILPTQIGLNSTNSFYTPPPLGVTSFGQPAPQYLNAPPHSSALITYQSMNPSFIAYKPAPSSMSMTNPTPMPPAVASHSSPAQMQRFKLWMQKLRRSGQLGPGGTEPEYPTNIGLPTGERPMKKSRHHEPLNPSLGPQYQNLDVLCMAVASHMGELRRSGYQKVPDFVGHFTTISGSTTEFFASNSQSIIGNLVQKAGLSIQ